jgi:DNA-binding winged helix-turn-helix (wHTH) protein/predicted ATPase
MPKDFTVLHYLAAQAGQLVTKEALLSAGWGKTRVSTGVLKNSIERIRRALGDSALKPRFIETVHGRGYRFVAAVTAAPVSSVEFQVPSSDTQDAALRTQHSVLVGREQELAHLHDLFITAASGKRQLVFVTGEPGIGKTALVDAFLHSLESGVQSLGSEGQDENQKSKGKRQKAKIEDPTPNPQPLTPSPWIGRGQCIEQYGTGEPYMPVLEAVERLSKGSGGERLVALLTQHAPTWLIQMPTLLSTAEHDALQKRTLDATKERMLREFAHVAEALATKQVFVLVLEDLHWADVSTLELLAMLARRREPARLLVLGTYRPTEVLGKSHPLTSVVHELQAHRLCSELALRFLSKQEVGAYLATRFPRSLFPTRLAQVLHRRTEGNPLFLVSVLDDLVAQGVVVQVEENWVVQGEVERLTTGVPENIRHLVALQCERLESEEQRVLEAASVAGIEFSVAAVAAALETQVVRVGKRCAWLAERQQFLRPAGIAEWPDGTVAARYGFIHALYQHLWHERVNIEQQQQWHLRIGERKETAYRDRVGEIAAELAVHFEQGRDYGRAVQYRGQAAQKALRRSANREAIDHLTTGLKLLETLPDTPERTQQELALQIALAVPLSATKGFAAPEVESAYTRAQELCQQIGETPQIFPVLWGLGAFYLWRGELEATRRLAEQLLRLAQRAQDPALLLYAHLAMGNSLLFLGEFPLVRDHLEQGIALYDPRQHSVQTTLPWGPDPGVLCLSRAAQTLWLLGYPTQALQRSREAITLAQELFRPWILTWALEYDAGIHYLRREGQLTRERTEAVIALASEQGFVAALAEATMLRGWALAEQGQGEEGVAQIRQGLAVYRTLESEVAWTYYLGRLAEAYGKVGQPAEGLNVLDEALGLVHKNGEHFWEAELYRLKGELLLQSKVERRKAKGEGQKSKMTTSHS